MSPTVIYVLVWCIPTVLKINLCWSKLLELCVEINRWRQCVVGVLWSAAPGNVTACHHTAFSVEGMKILHRLKEKRSCPDCLLCQSCISLSCWGGAGRRAVWELILLCRARLRAKGKVRKTFEKILTSCIWKVRPAQVRQAGRTRVWVLIFGVCWRFPACAQPRVCSVVHRSGAGTSAPPGGVLSSESVCEQQCSKIASRFGKPQASCGCSGLCPALCWAAASTYLPCRVAVTSGLVWQKVPGCLAAAAVGSEQKGRFAVQWYCVFHTPFYFISGEQRAQK